MISKCLGRRLQKQVQGLQILDQQAAQDPLWLLTSAPHLFLPGSLAPAGGQWAQTRLSATGPYRPPVWLLLTLCEHLSRVGHLGRDGHYKSQEGLRHTHTTQLLRAPPFPKCAPQNSSSMPNPCSRTLWLNTFENLSL